MGAASETSHFVGDSGPTASEGVGSHDESMAPEEGESLPASSASVGEAAPEGSSPV